MLRALAAVLVVAGAIAAPGISAHSASTDNCDANTPELLRIPVTRPLPDCELAYYLVPGRFGDILHVHSNVGLGVSVYFFPALSASPDPFYPLGRSVCDSEEDTLDCVLPKTASFLVELSGGSGTAAFRLTPSHRTSVHGACTIAKAPTITLRKPQLATALVCLSGTQYFRIRITHPGEKVVFTWHEYATCLDQSCPDTDFRVFPPTTNDFTVDGTTPVSCSTNNANVIQTDDLSLCRFPRAGRYLIRWQSVVADFRARVKAF